MATEYRETKNFKPEELEDLFLSVNWESGKYPNRLAEAMKNSSAVISAWDEGKLVGLVRSLDDGVCTAFIHYLLVRPQYRKDHIGGTLMKKILSRYADYMYVKIMPSDKALIPFYRKFGFEQYDNYCSLEIKRLGTIKDIIL